MAPKAKKKKPGPGRPAADPAKVAAGLERLDAGDAEGAVEKSGLSLATLYRAKAKRDGENGAPLPPSPPDAQASATIALPQGGAVSTRPDLLALVRRILSKRDPAALAELDAGLVVAAKGEEDLAAWLDRPLQRGAPPDPLEAAATALSAAAAYVDSLPPGSPRAATILGAAANLAKTVENIGKGRPREERPDEVTARLVAVRGKAVERVVPLIAEKKAKLKAWADDFAAWASGELRPADAGEVRRRVAALPGGLPS